MLQTIATASHISVQGELVRRLADGRVMVRVGKDMVVGIPLGSRLPGQASRTLATG